MAWTYSTAVLAFSASLAEILLPTDGELSLKAMSLVNHPMSDRRQNFSVSSNVSATE